MQRIVFSAFVSAVFAISAVSSGLAQTLPERARTEAMARRAAERLQALQREADRLATDERTLLGDLRKLEVERQIKAEELKRVDADASRAGRARQDERPDGHAPARPRQPPSSTSVSSKSTSSARRDICGCSCRRLTSRSGTGTRTVARGQAGSRSRRDSRQDRRRARRRARAQARRANWPRSAPRGKAQAASARAPGQGRLRPRHR